MVKRNIVKKDFALVHSRYNLTAFEMKFILKLVTSINADDTNFFIRSFHFSELEKGLQTKLNHTQVKALCRSIMGKVLEIPDGDSIIYTHWFSMLRYVPNKAIIEFRFDPLLLPYLLELKKRFVTYDLRNILPLKSAYSIRFYEIFKKHQKQVKFTLKLDDLYSMLQVPKSLQRYADFKRRVLKTIAREIPDNTDITFDIEEVKEGRKVISLEFRVYSKNKPKAIKSTPPTPKVAKNPLPALKNEDFSKYYGRNLKLGHKRYKNIDLIGVRPDGKLGVGFLDGRSVVITRKQLEICSK